MLGGPRIAAIALLPAMFAGCAGANSADQQPAAYFEGAIKAHELTRDTPQLAPVVAEALAPAPPEAPIIATVPVGITDVAPLAPPPPAPMPLAPPGEPAPPAAPAGPVPGDVAPPPEGAPPESVPTGDVDAVPEGVITPAPPPPNLPPRFEVVAQRADDRPDKAITYYVVIDRIDPNTDAFKMVVKQIIALLAANNGGPMFSVYIWDQLTAAQTEVGYRSNPDLFSQDVLDARDAFNGQHLIANYAGGLSSASEPPSYLLFWYPNSRPDTPVTGQWVGAEVWKP